MNRKTRGGGGVATPPTSRNHATAAGCTLVEYASSRGFDIEDLKGFGLSQITYNDRFAVRISYLGLDYQEIAVRFQIGQDELAWREGSKACLYGIANLTDGPDSTVIVYGEDSCHALWQQGILSVGIPRGEWWSEARDALYFTSVPRIYICPPPNEIDATIECFAHSEIASKVFIVDLGDQQGLISLYRADPEHFRSIWDSAVSSAVSLGNLAKATEAERGREAWEQCRDLANSPDILNRVVAALHAWGVAGEERAIKLLYLCFTSRLLDRIVSATLKGVSSSGKSFVAEKVLSLLPPSAFYTLSAMSERALVYSAEPLKHRFLVLFESAGIAGDFANYIIRSLLSEDRLRYETVERTPDGRLASRVIEREGPTGLLLSTTRLRLHPENETRFFSIPIDDSAAQTVAVLEAVARQDSGADIDPAWHALQNWLSTVDNRTVIPYAAALAKAINPVAVRLRRDFPAVLSLIRSHAFLHRATRHKDAEGRVIATLDDYTAVRNLVADLVAEGAGVSVSQTIRETVAAVQETGPRCTLKAVADILGLDDSAASRRVHAAISRGYVVNNESRRGHALQLELGQPLPEQVDVLPDPSDPRLKV